MMDSKMVITKMELEVSMQMREKTILTMRTKMMRKTMMRKRCLMRRMQSSTTSLMNRESLSERSFS